MTEKQEFEEGLDLVYQLEALRKENQDLKDEIYELKIKHAEGNAEGISFAVAHREMELEHEYGAMIIENADLKTKEELYKAAHIRYKEEIASLEKENELIKTEFGNCKKEVSRYIATLGDLLKHKTKLNNEKKLLQKELHDITVEKNKLSDRWDKLIVEVEKLKEIAEHERDIEDITLNFKYVSQKAGSVFALDDVLSILKPKPEEK
jgi:chromosome segregation ATPase